MLMKATLPFLSALLLASQAFAGTGVVMPETNGTRCSSSIWTRCAGTAGAYYRSSLGHTKVVLTNKTSGYMTFFVYSGTECGPNDINRLIRNGAHVYTTVVPPRHTSYTDERAAHYWVGSLSGKWGIDPTTNSVVRVP